MRDFWHWAANILPTDREIFDLERYARQAPRPEDYDLRAKLTQWHDLGIVTFEDCVAEADSAALLEDIAYTVQTRLPHLAASWIALEDVREDSGPLAYYPGSHKHGLIPPFDWGGGSIEQTAESTQSAEDFVHYLSEQVAKLALKKELFLPRRGSALIWHGNLAHGGTAVARPGSTRKSYVTHYTSLGSYPAACHFPDAMQSHRYTALNGGYVFDHPWVTDSRALPSWRRSTPD